MLCFFVVEVGDDCGDLLEFVEWFEGCFVFEVCEYEDYLFWVVFCCYCCYLGDEEFVFFGVGCFGDEGMWFVVYDVDDDWFLCVLVDYCCEVFGVIWLF